MTEDDFNDWREHPVTKWVFKAVAMAAEQQKAEWLRLSWECQKADQNELLVLHTRADSYLALSQTSYERWSDLHDTADA